jgi:hypothetical protein
MTLMHSVREFMHHYSFGDGIFFVSRIMIVIFSFIPIRKHAIALMAG